MTSYALVHISHSASSKVKVCPACGQASFLGRRKYCAPACRQRLLDKLAVLSGLLQALRVRYATFSFTQDTLVLNMVIWGFGPVYTFLWERSSSKKPSEDLMEMTEILGREWWREHNEKNSRHQACLHIMEKARTGLVGREQVRPLCKQSPKVSQKHLTVLALSRSQLEGKNAKACIKTAFRRQAMRHHPDVDGDQEIFLKVHCAYQELLEWVKAPVMTRQTGLPGKWAYNGRRWIPPLTGKHLAPGQKK
ncbi:MAG: hypothetical protein QMD09_09600 [Desulfatibacillaceae bacterium]|nr:hypothetical protein [Desulfatibacillaceae bacterium]